MTATLSAPGLLFAATSLLILAFNTRFGGLARLASGIIEEHHHSRDPYLLLRLQRMRKRMLFIRNLQISSALSLVLSIVTMYLLYNQQMQAAFRVFSVSVFMLVLALLFAVAELLLSSGNRALRTHHSSVHTRF